MLVHIDFSSVQVNMKLRRFLAISGLRSEIITPSALKKGLIRSVLLIPWLEQTGLWFLRMKYDLCRSCFFKKKGGHRESEDTNKRSHIKSHLDCQ
ncbi:hypothetical protein XENTR_v10001233 [Xenopus tropicalis]|nr:hypothetical protein XENTR_v10001233 [Xenopus tropicalis]